MATYIIGLVIVGVFVKKTAGRSLRGSAPTVEDPSEIDEILKSPDKALWRKEEMPLKAAVESDHNQNVSAK
ncbi:hypothetical protein [Bacillus sp. FJAT-29790]|uniref:hypothetical protein n=1 Tax=Bacillus sp. FJAT-29790 TaxID=1895002 RepID=UPI0020B2BDEF|nr:hypothetical protein [Bacillus sp. FJAT-29790]